MRLSKIGEFGLIERLRDRSNLHRPEVLLGIGDDAAVLAPGNDMHIVATTDMLIENIHFDLTTTTMRQLGMKSMAVNVSDVAAMGAEPVCALVSIGIPGDPEVGLIDQLYAGLLEEASAYGVDVAGGDTVRSPTFLVINVMLIGKVQAGKAITRGGASPGDKILVTGDLGGSAAGLYLLSHASTDRYSQSARDVIARHLEPHARLNESRIIREHGPSSMIDVSDGLANEVNHICSMSGVGAIIFADEIPIHESVRQIAQLYDQDALNWALFGGEDYELLFTARADKVEEICRSFRERSRIAVNVIGEVLPPEKGCIIRISGSDRTLLPKAYDHFAPAG